MGEGIILYRCMQSLALTTSLLLLALLMAEQAAASPPQLAAGLEHSVYVDARGRLWAWGSGHLGQLGPRNAADSATAARPLSRLRRVRLLATGWSHNLALTRSGQLLAWGFGDAGQLGVGLMAPYTATRGWVMDQPAVVPGIGRPQALAAGVAHSLAVMANGTLWAWGWNGAGQLGLADRINRWSPVMNPYLNGVQQVAAGGSHSLALLGTGVVMAWGLNDHGQLGDGSTVDHSIPAPVFGIGPDEVMTLAAGNGFSLALDSAGHLWAWGANDVGQLGLGTTTDQTAPQRVPNLPALKAISAGSGHVLALTREGTLFSWGANDCGQLGDGTAIPRSTPLKVQGLPPMEAMAAGFHHNLALDRNRHLWVWGSNDHLQLGLATPTPCLAMPQMIMPPS